MLCYSTIPLNLRPPTDFSCRVCQYKLPYQIRSNSILMNLAFAHKRVLVTCAIVQTPPPPSSFYTQNFRGMEKPYPSFWSLIVYHKLFIQWDIPLDKLCDIGHGLPKAFKSQRVSSYYCETCSVDLNSEVSWIRVIFLLLSLISFRSKVNSCKILQSKGWPFLGICLRIASKVDDIFLTGSVPKRGKWTFYSTKMIFF